LDILKKKTEHFDDEKTFLLTHLPAFKKLNEDQKYWAKMEMLVVMRKAKNMVFQPQFEQSFNASASFLPSYE
jgi:hypothetical protein